ncbi:MAG TPA: hypothetical protein VHW23_24770 [Kofleriaceae bacterium]|nr:hypothetical protein [Kofleriaceae bacterium]
MKPLALCMLGLALACGAAQAGPPRDCSKPAARKLRKDADQAAGAKDYAKAIALLEPFLRDCPVDDQDPVDRGWLASDLAVDYEKNGQLVECQRLLGPLSYPRAAVQRSGDDKLIHAIGYNLDHCSKAFDARYAAVKPGGCTLSLGRAIATAAAPAALVPRGAAAACVALVHGKPAVKSPDDDPESRDVVCPRVVLAWKGAKSSLELQDLSGGDPGGALADDSVCCNLSTIAAGTVAGKTLVRVRGHGRDCSGGTADAESDMFYEWNGKALTPGLNASVSYH